MRRARLCFWMVACVVGLMNASGAARADDVTLTTYLPSPDWEDYKWLQVRNQLTIDDNVATAGLLDVFGNLDVWNGNVSISGSINPIHFGRAYGPYSGGAGMGIIDGLRVQPALASSCVSIGTNTCSPTLAKLKVYTAMRSDGLYVKPSGPDPHYLYAYARWTGTPCVFASPSNPDGTRRGFLGARRLTGALPNEAVDTYAHMRLEARVIELGDWRRADMGLPVTPCPPNPPARFKWCWTEYVGHPNFGDTQQGVLVGVDTIENPLQEDNIPATTPTWRDKIVILQVGSSAAPMDAVLGSINWMSSRTYKKDIVPLGADEMKRFLDETSQRDVVRYHYLGDNPERALRVGLIAEDAPAEFSDGKVILVTRAAAYLTASMKALKAENDALRARIEVLEAKKAALRKAR